MIINFVIGTCGCSGNWTADSFIESTVQNSKELGRDKAILGISGGADSSVAASFNRAAGKNHVSC
jgi:GMP synthase (glutamine-hydrolysing)